MKKKIKGAYIGIGQRLPHQNISKLICATAAQNWFFDGLPIEQTIKNHRLKKFEKPEDDPKFDFMICTKIPRSSRLVTYEVNIQGYNYSDKDGYEKLPGLKEFQKDDFDQTFETKQLTQDRSDNKIVEFGNQIEQNRVARYHVSTDQTDPFLVKIMPELESKPGSGDRLFNLESGYHINMCTKASEFNWETLNYEYYIKEAEKLINLEEIDISTLN